jgi:hypothetical protein
MAKNERVKVELKGRTRMLSPRAFEIATKHFGARRQSIAEKQIPVELLVIPPKHEIVKPKLVEVPSPVIPDVAPPEAKVIVPGIPEIPKVIVKKGTKKAKK